MSDIERQIVLLDDAEIEDVWKHLTKRGATPSHIGLRQIATIRHYRKELAQEREQRRVLVELLHDATLDVHLKNHTWILGPTIEECTYTLCKRAHELLPEMEWGFRSDPNGAELEAKLTQQSRPTQSAGSGE